MSLLHIVCIDIAKGGLGKAQAHPNVGYALPMKI